MHPRLHERARSLTGEYALTSMPDGDPETFQAIAKTLAREYAIPMDEALDHAHEAVSWNQEHFFLADNACDRKGADDV